MKIRDPYTGKPIDDEEYLRGHINKKVREGIHCFKKRGAYDIDLRLSQYEITSKNKNIITKIEECYGKGMDEKGNQLLETLSQKLIALIECEGCRKYTWSSGPYPNWKSRKITIPLRRLYEFADYPILKEKYISERGEFFANKVDKIVLKPYPIPRFWVKISYTAHNCICADDLLILKQVNSDPEKNIWKNPEVTRAEATTILLGGFDDNELVWGFDNLIPFMEKRVGIKLSNTS